MHPTPPAPRSPPQPPTASHRSPFPPVPPTSLRPPTCIARRSASPPVPARFAPQIAWAPPKTRRNLRGREVGPLARRAFRRRLGQQSQRLCCNDIRYSHRVVLGNRAFGRDGDPQGLDTLAARTRVGGRTGHEVDKRLRLFLQSGGESVDVVSGTPVASAGVRRFRCWSTQCVSAAG
jgi:hypothetical protein